MSESTVALGIIGTISVLNCIFFACGVRRFRMMARKVWALENRIESQSSMSTPYSQPVYVSAPGGYQYYS